MKHPLAAAIGIFLSALPALPGHATEYEPVVSEPRWIVPSTALPKEIRVQASNNNVAIAEHAGRLYLAWRSSKNHFAHAGTEMHLISSSDGGGSWDFERTIATGRDLREPFFLSFRGALQFFYLELGTKPTSFEPGAVWRISRSANGSWSAPQSWGEPGEVAWEFKVRNGQAWATSYRGNHYESGKGAIALHLSRSDDGIDWAPVDAGNPVVYKGGVSEAGFEFDSTGNLWAVTRNEDGDDSGFGSHVAYARSGALGTWEFPAKSDPARYDSPRMFQHEGEIYLIARRDLGGPFDRGFRHLPFAMRRLALWLRYWLTPKRTALYRIDRDARKVVHLQDLPSAGDTAFPSILQTGPHRFLVANYTSPPKRSRWSWLHGQISRKGTGIYFVTIDFRER